MTGLFLIVSVGAAIMIKRRGELDGVFSIIEEEDGFAVLCSSAKRKHMGYRLEKLNHSVL